MQYSWFNNDEALWIISLESTSRSLIYHSMGVDRYGLTVQQQWSLGHGNRIMKLECVSTSTDYLFHLSLVPSSDIQKLFIIEEIKV